MAPSPMSPSAEPRWSATVWIPILASGLIMGLALGARHMQGLFLLPITMDRGWSRESFAKAMAVQNLIWGLAMPFAGMVADRFGSTQVIASGLVLYGIGLAGMVAAPTAPLFVLAAGVMVGLAQSGTTFGVVFAALNRLMPAPKRSWALGLAGAIGGLGQFAMVPISQTLISTFGWEIALLVFAVVAPFMLPLVLLVRSPHQRIQAPVAQGALRAALAEAFRHPGFRLLNFGFLICGFQLTFAQTYLPSYLLDNGLGASEGVAALALMALLNVLGTYLFGVWGGTARKKYLLMLIYLLRTAAIALFVSVPLSTTSVYAFSSMLGFLLLSTVPLTNGLIAQIFGVRFIGTLFGILFVSHQMGSFVGIWVGGYLFETNGSYQLGWVMAVALGVIGTAVHWPIVARPAFEDASRA